MNLKEIERVVGMIQSQIFKNSNSHSSGILKSQFRGSGLQFREHQIYVPGDDVRFIDWKLSARSSNVYIKTFEEERNVEIVIMLDLSLTLLYGYNQISKLQAIIEVIALLYVLAGETNDLVRVVIWGEKSIVLPLKNGKEGLTVFISYLEKLNILLPDGKVNLDSKGLNFKVSETEKINQMKMYLAKKKELIYLGDFSCFESFSELTKLIEKKNFHTFRIVSPVDENFSEPYLLTVKNPLNNKTESLFLNSKNQNMNFVENKKIKKIGVHERYLEKFISELV